MKFLLRSATLCFSRPHRYNDYQVLDRGSGNSSAGGLVTSSTRDLKPSMFIPSSSQGLNRGAYDSRIERAKKRQIFLKSYKLSFPTPVEAEPLSARLKKSFAKVKPAVLSILRWKVFRACRICGPSALCVSSPRPLVRIVPVG